MNDASIPVLETLHKAGIAISAGAIQYELERTMKRPPSRSTITRALRELQNHELVTKPDEDKIYYELTDKGRKSMTENSTQ
ncbi:helix-turn-helix transcriptional regulator [Halobium salinum]|uniref:Helix-turn-helix transcriptional regulator n=1 Tax=Halobium salinum TaxID=1364940 RepID=A0ABD5PEJ3_9EURY|nr:helix-turn-helix transcriptional regulator [Halobium salinum]